MQLQKKILSGPKNHRLAKSRTNIGQHPSSVNDIRRRNNYESDPQHPLHDAEEKKNP